MAISLQVTARGETKPLPVESNHPMKASLIRLTMGTLSLVVLLGLSLLRIPSGQVKLRPLTSQPQPVRILRFFATSGALIPGETAQLCYSVENARVIRISPAVETASASPGRCVEVRPDHTTHYTLQAEGFDGSTAVRSLTLPVQDPAPPRLPVHVAMLR
jgi:hypothetical protein